MPDGPMTDEFRPESPTLRYVADAPRSVAESADGEELIPEDTASLVRACRPSGLPLPATERAVRVLLRPDALRSGRCGRRGSSARAFS